MKRKREGRKGKKRRFRRPPPVQGCYRILDANYNRAKEALRMSEDLMRFMAGHRELALAFKNLRHRLSRLLLNFPVAYGSLVAARDAPSDPGRGQWVRDRSSKPDCRDLLTANLKRAQEAVRVLEEISKIVAGRRAPAFEKIRFELYELEKKALRKF